LAGPFVIDLIHVIYSLFTYWTNQLALRNYHVVDHAGNIVNLFILHYVWTLNKLNAPIKV